MYLRGGGIWQFYPPTSIPWRWCACHDGSWRWADRRRMGRAECSLLTPCVPRLLARDRRGEGERVWLHGLACCLATLHGLETRRMREREKEVATGFGNSTDRTTTKRLPCFEVSARAKRTMCAVVVGVVDDLCVVVVLPDMHRQSRWTVISLGPRQVRMGEKTRRGAVRRDLSAPRERGQHR